MLEDYLNILKPKIETIFSNDTSGHDIGHLERTMNCALHIQEHEGGDRLVIGIAAYLHDIHRALQNSDGRYCSPSESLPVIKELLSYINLPLDKVDKILNSIEYHEVYKWHDSQDKRFDIETLILQDADNLDATGAIGIVRAFLYGGAHGVKMYNPDIPLNFANDFSEENSNDESTIHHFHHKLLKLGDGMNTKTAKLIAKKRIDFMKVYIDEFMSEWNGLY